MAQTYRLIKHIHITLPSTHRLILKAGGQCSGRNKTNPTEEVYEAYDWGRGGACPDSLEPSLSQGHNPLFPLPPVGNLQVHLYSDHQGDVLWPELEKW